MTCNSKDLRRLNCPGVWKVNMSIGQKSLDLSFQVLVRTQAGTSAVDEWVKLVIDFHET
jgi:hypothetical protein